MCGIVAYLGYREAYPILIKGLHRLEYRGYDSAGVVVLNDEDKLNIYKAVGKVSNLEQEASGHDCSGSIGIAHTRWATHGAPNQVNAHPHLSQSGNITMVHNGIIENASSLREQLKEKGFSFRNIPCYLYCGSSGDFHCCVVYRQQLFNHFQFKGFFKRSRIIYFSQR